MKLLRHSLVARIVAYLLAISGMAIISISLTLVIAHHSQDDAAAINVAGSLRMTTAQIIEVLQRTPSTEQSSNDVDRLSEKMGTSLNSPTLHHFGNDQILEQREGLQQHWHNTLMPMLEQAIDSNTADNAQIKATFNRFIVDIDRFVTLLEASSVSKVRLINALQVLFLALIGILLLMALYDVRHHLAIPLHKLIILSKAAGRQDFHPRSNFKSHDELGQLGRTFDQMAAKLTISYRELEASVSFKQAELERHNRALQIIHRGSRKLYGGGNDLCASATPILRQLESLLEIGPIVLALRNEHDANDMEILATHSSERPIYCRDLACFACLEDPQTASEIERNTLALALPVTISNITFGYLTVGYKTLPSPSTRQLLNTLTDHLATALYLQQRIEEQQQLSLIKERTIIARELHDSLAQSLSYLKMQVARLERMQAKQFSAEQQSGVMIDLREGLNSAYRQLRELLSTFRLSLDKPGLQPSLQQTVNEFSERLGFSVELIYQVPPHLLSPNEEIHLLQITREALANTLKHARAHWTRVSMTFYQAALHLAIEDDGIGLEDDCSPPMHYGLIIMRDRAKNIDADLILQNRSEGGTGVYLSFTPKAERLIE